MSETLKSDSGQFDLINEMLLKAETRDRIPEKNCLKLYQRLETDFKNKKKETK